MLGFESGLVLFAVVLRNFTHCADADWAMALGLGLLCNFD